MDSMPINPVDGIVVAAIILSGVLALVRGLVREVLSLISWMIAIYAGVQGAPMAKGFMLNYTESDTIASGLGGFAVFFVVLVILTIISHFIAKAVRNSGLSAIDRSLGFIFGAARGFLVAALIYLGGTLIFTNEKDYPSWLSDAKTEPALHASAMWLQSMMPKELQEDIGAGAKSAKDTAGQAKQTKDTLERLTTPVPGRLDEKTKDEPKKDPYDAKTREQLNNLIQQDTQKQ